MRDWHIMACLAVMVSCTIAAGIFMALGEERCVRCRSPLCPVEHRLGVFPVYPPNNLCPGCVLPEIKEEGF